MCERMNGLTDKLEVTKYIAHVTLAITQPP